MTDVPEPEQSDDQNERLQESANEAWNAAAKALYAFVLVLMILLARALQALFVLARPAIYLASAISAGYTSVTLFTSVLAHYGGDISAFVLALSSVIIVPASLLVLAGDYGIWAVLICTAALELLARLAIERAPPVVLSFVPVLALASLILYHLTRQDSGTCVPESKTQGESDETTNGIRSSTLAGDDQPDHFHRDEDGAPDHDDSAR